MKFKMCLPVDIPEEILSRDYQDAQNFGNVRMGEQGIYFPKFSGTSYLPYSAVSRAWLRHEPIHTRGCCGSADIDQFFFVVQETGGQQREAKVISSGIGKDALDRLSRANPAVEIGLSEAEA